MNRFRLSTYLTTLAGLLACGILWGGTRLTAQPSMMGTASNFTMSEYYDAPHETQMKSLITGKQAQPQAGGRYLIKQLHLETYREDGVREMIVEAPECIYDGAKRRVSSAGPLHAQTSDGQFTLEGHGFLWLQATSALTISNRVHTIIKNALLQ